MTLYECGHAFHIKCIERHIREGARLRRAPGERAPQLEVTLDMLDQQQCPWCYSEKFKVDFDAALKKSTRRGVGAAASRQSRTEDTLAESTHSGSSSDMNQHGQGYSQEERQQMVNSRRNQRSASVSRQARSLQEQKLTVFSATFTNEGVNMFNFDSFH